jgi:fido (protein-threonine AMPylation protein)
VYHSSARIYQTKNNHDLCYTSKIVIVFETAMPPDIHMDPRLERRLAEKKAALDLQRPLSPAIVSKLYDDLRVRLTYHSNAIEGNTLDLSETQLVVDHGVTIGGHTMREHLEAVHHADAYALLLDLARAEAPLDEAALQALHALALRELVDAPGEYRRAAVFISGSEHRPPHHTLVPQLMRELVKWIVTEGQAYTPIIRAALTHQMFLAIHPFPDGNGRTARLLLNLQLMRDGYPIVLLLARQCLTSSCALCLRSLRSAQSRPTTWAGCYAPGASPGKSGGGAGTPAWRQYAATSKRSLSARCRWAGPEKGARRVSRLGIRLSAAYGASTPVRNL